MATGTAYGTTPGGPSMAAVLGPGDHLWQPYLVRGTIHSNIICHRWSGGPVLGAICGMTGPVPLNSMIGV